MKYLNAVELQSVHEAGGVLSVALLCEANVFEVHIVTAGGAAVLVAHDNRQPMQFDNEPRALSQLNKLGISSVDTVEAWEIAKIKSSLTGLRDGSTRVFTASEWAAMRAARKVSRDLS